MGGISIKILRAFYRTFASGGGLHPPTPSALGRSLATPRPNRLKNTLYVYWVHFLAHEDQILPRGAFLALWVQFWLL